MTIAPFVLTSTPFGGAVYVRPPTMVDVMLPKPANESSKALLYCEDVTDLKVVDYYHYCRFQPHQLSSHCRHYSCLLYFRSSHLWSRQKWSSWLLHIASSILHRGSARASLLLKFDLRPYQPFISGDSSQASVMSWQPPLHLRELSACFGRS